jgi:hypothetical protein
MATGSGKTVVMAMLIAWHTLNKRANPKDVRFSDTFLVVTPGITIRDRLRVLLPNDPENYYRQRDIVPASSCKTSSARPKSSSPITMRSSRENCGRRQAYEIHSWGWEAQARSPKPPIRWCAAYAAS